MYLYQFAVRGLRREREKAARLTRLSFIHSLLSLVDTLTKQVLCSNKGGRGSTHPSKDTDRQLSTRQTLHTSVLHLIDAIMPSTNSQTNIMDAVGADRLEQARSAPTLDRSHHLLTTEQTGCVGIPSFWRISTVRGVVLAWRRQRRTIRFVVILAK
jgi:hypothetical protein